MGLSNSESREYVNSEYSECDGVAGTLDTTLSRGLTMATPQDWQGSESNYQSAKLKHFVQSTAYW